MASAANKALLFPFQQAWLKDDSRFKLWVASRQIGKSFTLALDAVSRAMQDGVDQLLLSASMRQSKALMRKVYMHLRAIKRLSRAENLAARENSEECELENGAIIVSLPANPDTARGFSGDVTLDEFAIHKDSRAIWRALFPSITRGYRISVASTPLGKQGQFYDIHSRNDRFSKHLTTIEDAVKDGLEIDIDELREGLNDPEGWAQEFMCEFVDEATAFLTHELITACEFDPDLEPVPAGHDLYHGVDIGRRKDLTVIWALTAIMDVLWSQEVKVLSRTPFSIQREELFARLENSRRCCIDETGLGMQLAEEAVEAYGKYRVEPVTFTNKTKEALAYQLKAKMEDRQVRIPIDRDIHNDLHSLKRVVTAAGNMRFDVESSETKGHGDRFWALALGVGAASTPPAHIAYESVAKRRARMDKGAW